MAVTDPISNGFTLADLESMPDDGRRYELIGGSIIVTPPPSIGHQRPLSRLFRRLADLLDPALEVFPAPVGLALPTGDYLEPDIVAVEAGREGTWLHLPVELVVEFISPGSARHDTVTKLDAYARAGIENYWLVDTAPTNTRSGR